MAKAPASIVESDQSAIKPTPIRCLGLERRILVVWTGVIPIWETALRPQHSGFRLGKRLCRTHQQYATTRRTPQDRTQHGPTTRIDVLIHAGLEPIASTPTLAARKLYCQRSNHQHNSRGAFAAQAQRKPAGMVGQCHRSMRGQSRRPGRRWRQWQSRASLRRDAFPAAYRTCHISP